MAAELRFYPHTPSNEREKPRLLEKLFSHKGNVSSEQQPSVLNKDKERRKEDARQVAAKIVQNAAALDRFIEMAYSELPLLRQRYAAKEGSNAPQDLQLVLERVTGFVDAYKVVKSKKEGAGNSDEVKSNFQRQKENSDELLARVEPLYDDLRVTENEILKDMMGRGTVSKNLKREQAWYRIRRRLGKSGAGLVFEGSGMPLEEQKSLLAGWVSTAGAYAAWEGPPIVAGSATAYFDLTKYIGLESDLKLAAATVFANTAMWALMYGPNTKGNINLLEKNDASITLGAKIGHQAAKLIDSTEEERRRRAKYAHWVDLTAWEIFYAGKSILIGAKYGLSNGLQDSLGGAGYGLAKNIVFAAGTWNAFERPKVTARYRENRSEGMGKLRSATYALMPKDKNSSKASMEDRHEIPESLIFERGVVLPPAE